MNEQPNGLVLKLKHVVDSPRERIFNLLTEPAELAKWWGPHGFTTPEVALDLSVGGRYRFTMQPPEGEAFHLSGEFIEIDPPTRLVYTFRWDEPDPTTERQSSCCRWPPSATPRRCRSRRASSQPTNGSRCTAMAGRTVSRNWARSSRRHAPSAPKSS